MSRKVFATAVLLLPLVASCAAGPMGPRVQTLPGKHQSFEQFRAEDLYCREQAAQQVQASGAGKQAEEMTKAAVVTGLIGTAFGAIVGGVTGSPGQGAALGGATGGVLGAAGGAGASQKAAEDAQRAYDAAYLACAYSRGLQVPSMATMSR